MTDVTQSNESESSGAAAVQAAASLAKQAGGEAKAVSQDVREQGRQLVATSVDELRGQAVAQTTRLTDGLRDATQQLRWLAVGDPQPGMVADLVQQLADATERAADRLGNGGLDGAMGDLRRIARNQTGLFLLGALGAGVVAGRVLRTADTRSIVETAKETFADAGDESAPEGGVPTAATSGETDLRGAAAPVAVGVASGPTGQGGNR